MSRRARILLGLLILLLSVALLILGFQPLERVRRVQPISPSDLQLPTPSSIQFEPLPVS
jgi:hypothetical protein